MRPKPISSIIVYQRDFKLSNMTIFFIPFAFESIESLLKWHSSTTHGVFDLSLVTEERLQKYLAPYLGKNGKPCLDFRGIKEESPVYKLIAVKQAANAKEENNG